MSLLLTDVSKGFGDVTVLERVSIEVPRGSRLAVVGASGSGKSTLLRVIAGFERPDGGFIALDGRTLADGSTNVPAHRRGIGYVAQDGALFPHLTVAGNIGFGLSRGSRRAPRVREMMQLVSLEPALANRYPHQLSGGQQQRVALARALALEPEVILLDEPFSALDTGLRAATREAMVAALEASGVTTVLVTHDQEEALSFGHRIGVISGGRLVQSGRPAEVFDAPLDAEIAEFLGDVVMVPAQPTGDALAVCAFGCLRVRHDRSEGAERVCAMLRPSQLRVGDSAQGVDATIVGLRSAGSSAELRLRLGGPDVTVEVTHRVPLHEASRYRLGSAVVVSVDGGVVLYPETPTLPRSVVVSS